MSDTYEIRVRGSALENLKKAREALFERLGNDRIGERLASLDHDQAGLFANDLLALLDAIDGVVSRAKKVD